jgi:hypothetical protein
MAGLENLFAAEPTLPSVQTFKMPDSSQEWAEIITTKLKERYPDVVRLPMTVEFRKKEDSSGTAIGGVHVHSGESDKQIIIPFVIRKFELCPLDIWMETPSQAVHPLTNDTFKEEFFVQSPAESLDQRPADSAGQYFNDPSMWTTNYPPLQGRYSYASAGYPILDSIADTIAKEDADVLKVAIQKHPELLIGFKKHGHQELITKLAKKTGPMTNSFSESAMKLIPVGVAHIKKESPDKYSILSLADRLFDLAASEHCSREAIKERLSKITKDVDVVLHDVDQEGERMCVMKPAPTKGVWLYDDMTDKAELINDLAVVAVKTKEGLKLEGVVLPKVVDFKGNKKSYKLFISPDHSSMQETVAGVRHPDSDMMKKLLGAKGARVGQTGTFVYIDDGKAIATEPVTIKAIEDYGPITAVRLQDGVKIKISRGFGDRVMASGGKSQNNFLDAHGMIEVKPKEYVIPLNMHWVPMEGFQEVSSSINDYMMKEAASHMDMDPMSIRWTGVVYQADHSDIGKNEFNERELKVVLAAKGAPVEKIASIISKVRAVGRTKVYGLGKLRKKAEIIKEANETYSKLNKIASSIKTTLVKEAAELEDASTVDAVLSLNFINPENLAKFVSYKSVFRKVADYIAELVLASRLGLKDVSESALTVSMSHLGEICKGLDKIEASLKVSSVKTAGDLKSAISEWKNKNPSALKKPPKDKKAAIALGIAGIGGLGYLGLRKGSNQQKHASQAEALISPAEEDHFANGMADGESGMPLHMESARKAGATAFHAYLNGKRTTEMNQAQSQLSLGGAPKKLAKK